MALSVASNGCGFPFMAKCVYNYLCGFDLLDIQCDIDCIADEAFHNQVYEV